VIAWLLSNLAGIGATLAAILAVVGGAYLKGRSAGKAVERQKQEKDANDFLAETAEAHAGIDALSDDDLNRRLRYPSGKLPSGR